MKENAKSKNRILNSIALILAIIMTSAALLLGCKIAIMNVVPWYYLGLFALIVIALDSLTWNTIGKKAITIIMTLLTVCFSAVMIFGYVAVSKVDSTVKKVTSAGNEIVQVSMIVREDSSIQNFSDLNGAKIGYLSGSEYVWTVIDMAGQEAMLGDITEYENVVSLAEALVTGETDAVVLNTAYIEIVNDFEGYETFSLSVRNIFTTEIEIDSAMSNSMVAGGNFPADEPTVDENVTTIGDSSTVDLETKEYQDDTLIMYISGIDTWGNVNVRSRSDVNILAVINTRTGRLLMVNTPRDSYVTLVTKDGAKDKLTHAGLYGIDCSMSAIEDLYGIDIDYYVRMNFSGFESIVDALDGIDVYSEKSFRVDDTQFVVGINHLEGEDALRFARERYSFAGQGDIQRGRNQMEVIKAVIGKMTSFGMISNYTDVLDAVGDCVMTDMPTEELYNLVKFQLATGTSWTFDTYTVGGSNGSEITYSIPGAHCYVMIPDEEKIEEAKQLINEVLNE